MRGQPTKYKPEYADEAYRLALLGATNEQIADYFNVNPDTIYQWIKKYPEFAESLKRGGMIADAAMTQLFYQSAFGCILKETRTVTNKDGVTTTVIEKQRPPDLRYATFWLCNRQPLLWKIKPDPPVPPEDNVREIFKLGDREIEF